MELNAFNLFDNLEFRSASTPKKDVTTPVAFKIGLDCHHQPILREDQIHEVSRNYDPITGGSDIKLVCPLCAKNAPGSCNRTAIHKILDITPMFSRQLKSASETPNENNNNESSAKAAVDHWFELYRNVPESHKPAFRKSLELQDKTPTVY